ncbi:MAG TPA: ATP-binding protein [Actinomycetota bacterium]|jgi:PAS domain S-box-containing protein
MKRRVWWLYVAAGGVLLVLYYVGPGWARSGPVFNVFGASAFLGVVAGILINRPKHWAPWALMAVGLALFFAGDVITYNPGLFYGVNNAPFPSMGDLFYVLVYPMLMAGVLWLIRLRSPGRDRTALIDTIIITTGVGVLSWVYLMAPNAHATDQTLIQKLTSIAYPLGDLLLLGAMVRLAVGGGKRAPAFYLLMASAFTLLATDIAYSVLLTVFQYNGSGSFLDAGWACYYLFWGAAALHPSMFALDQPAPLSEQAVGGRRLWLLAGASLVAPAVIGAQALRGMLSDSLPTLGQLGSREADTVIVAAAAAVLFVLVLVRLKGLMVDVAEYRRAEKALQEAESKYRSLVEGLPAIVYIAELGKEGDWLYVSPQIESVLGYTAEEWTSGSPRLWQERLHPVDRDRAVREQTRLVAPGERILAEYRLVAQDGSVVWIRDDAEVLADEHGNPELLQGVMYDFSEQKRAESKLREALDREREAGQHLRKLDAMKNSFLEAVSHDLRTPLTNILAGALTLQNEQIELSPEDTKDLIARLAANARKLDRLLSDLLDLDRLSRGILAPNRKPTDLAEVVNTVVRECDLNGHPVEVRAESLVAEIDPAQFERIVENLVTNAARYTPPGTPIWVRVEGQERGALLIVEDSGPGIAPELRQTIFEPFRQGNARVEHSPGVGIGLSLVARFAALHSGRAWVEERPGGGASFRVYLPKQTPVRAMAS